MVRFPASVVKEHGMGEFEDRLILEWSEKSGRIKELQRKRGRKRKIKKLQTQIDEIGRQLGNPEIKWLFDIASRP